MKSVFDILHSIIIVNFFGKVGLLYCFGWTFLAWRDLDDVWLALFIGIVFLIPFLLARWREDILLAAYNTSWLTFGITIADQGTIPAFAFLLLLLFPATCGLLSVDN